MMMPDPTAQAMATQGAAPGPSMGQPSGIGALVPMHAPHVGRHGKAAKHKGGRHGRAHSKRGR